jgi:uncharacterized damage-inducible protein DinB
MVERPKSVEAAPYYFTYINRVPDGADLLATMEAQLREGTTLFSQISEESSLHRYARDKWSIRQVLNHISDAERVFSFRALWFARGFRSALPSFEQNTAATAAEADQISWASHIEDFKRVRLASISLFRNLPTEAWLHSGTASDNEFTVRALGFIVVGHFTHHMSTLRERYL